MECIMIIGSNFDTNFEEIFASLGMIVYSIDIKDFDEKYENNENIKRYKMNIMDDEFHKFYHTICDNDYKTVYVIDSISCLNQNEHVLNLCTKICELCLIPVYYKHYISPYCEFPSGNPSLLDQNELIYNLQQISPSIFSTSSKPEVFLKNFSKHLQKESSQETDYLFLNSVLENFFITDKGKYHIRDVFSKLEMNQLMNYGWIEIC